MTTIIMTLENRLRTFGGKSIKWLDSKRHNVIRSDVQFQKQLCQCGVLINPKDHLIHHPMEMGDCFGNSAKLRDGKEPCGLSPLTLWIGFALPYHIVTADPQYYLNNYKDAPLDEHWRPHSWCRYGGMIIETTLPFSLYFGIQARLDA